MPIAKSEPLFRLIKSLSKSEKRHFKLYANRSDVNKDALFVRLFDIMDYKRLRSDESIIEKLGLKKSAQLSNTRRHLYSQLLKSLRILYAHKHAQITTNEAIDFAIILDYKKLYHDSYELLDRINLGYNDNYSQNYLTITKYKRRISTHLNEPINKLESMKARQYLNTDWQIEDLQLDIQNDFINLGFSRNEREFILRKERFVPMISILSSRTMTIYQKFTWHKLYELYYTTACNHVMRYRHALYQYHYLTQMPYKHNEENYIDLLLQCTTTLLEVTHQINDINKFQKWYKILNSWVLRYNQTREKHGGSEKMLSLNLNILKSLVQNDDKNIKDTIERALISITLTTTDRYIIAEYFAYIGDYHSAIDQLNSLINDETMTIDLHLYARFLALQCHYRLNNFELVDNLAYPLRTAFKTNGYLTKTLDAAFALTRKGVKALNFGLKDDINEILNKFKVYAKTPYEKTSFLYFDFYYWFESIKLDTSLQKVKY